MTTQRPHSLSPYQHAIDPTTFCGYTVLGEPLEVLVSFLLRIELKKSEQPDLMSFEGCWPTHEVESVIRAMTRVDPDIGRGSHTAERQEAGRLAAVLLQAATAMHAASMFDRRA